MKHLRTIMLAAMITAGLAYAGSAPETPRPVTQSARAPVNDVNPKWMAEGEQRFRVNCGRCHQFPHKFQSRVMATAVRHMRVRGMLSDEDMKYVLYYVTH
jgi:hypothetical protein